MIENWISIILVLTAYLLGSIPTSLILGKLFHGIDIRDHGSGNAGATNTFRVLGKKTGIPVLLFDMFKGWLAVYLSVYSSLQAESLSWLQIALGVSVVTGHVYPVFAGFRGGKGIASLFGVFLFLLPVPVLLSLAVFIIVFIPSGFVSLGSIFAGISLPVFALFAIDDAPIYLVIFTFAISLFVIYTHRKNIKRLVNGTENRFNILKRKKK
jgi:acyl phosphate:glycerol-3-phosphate acyltransferase